MPHGEKIEFELDPRLSFSQNAARLFRRAARLERALPQRERRMTQAQALRKAIGRWLSAPILSDPWYSLSDGRTGNMRPGGKDPSLQDARRMLAGIETGLRKRWQRALEEWEQASRERSQPLDQAGYDARRGGGARREARAAAGRPRESATAGRRTARGAGLAAGDRAASVERDAAAGGVHPRKFELPGGWVVLVGRSNRENDVLTHRLARPNDLWFHARGAAGSHVVLRRGGRKDNPPRDIISRTAAIAAYFSKARTSAMVPVIYTEKRHVRKPRKGAPGLALCTHEKVVMVAPGLP
jgi:hypothetical protein